MRKGDFNPCSLRAGRKESKGEETGVAVGWLRSAGNRGCSLHLQNMNFPKSEHLVWKEMRRPVIDITLMNKQML